MTGPDSATDRRSPERLARRILLIGWDAADWRMIDPLVEQGLMPHLRRFLEHGVMGNVASLTPMLSPVLWTSVATGKHADKHDILGFAEPDGATGRVRPVTSTSRKCKALWNILSERGLRAGAVNWFASHPAEPINGFVVTDRLPHPVGPRDQPWPVVDRSVHPAAQLDAVAALRVHPADTTPPQLVPFLPHLLESGAADAEPVRHLRTLLANCATVQAVTTHLMQTQPWDFLGVYYDTIDRVGHAFMQFHPPQREDVSDDDFRRYQHVMTGCYRFHDMMLGRLMELAGDDTTVIILSDHGFYSDELRPAGGSRISDGQPVAWHRPYGVIAMHGPHIKKDERVYGASLLDVAPTILTMLGLPVADDMDGQVLTSVFESAVEPVTIPTYEDPDSPRAEPASPDEDPWVAQQMLEQLEALGYLDANDTEGVLLDRLRNLGQVYLSTNRPSLAIEQFADVLARKPDDTGAKTGTASALLQLGRLDECEAHVRSLAERGEVPHVDLYLGMIHFRRGDADAALDCLQRAERSDGRLPGLHAQIGQVYLHQRRWEDAQRAFEQAIERDVDNAEAHDGLGVCHRQLKRPGRAVFEHMEAIGRLHHRPQSHVNLGLALAEVGRARWAIRAFETALSMAPDHPIAHQALAQLYDLGFRNREKAEEHREAARVVLGRLRAGADADAGADANADGDAGRR